MVNAPYAIRKTDLLGVDAAEYSFGVLSMVNAPYAIRKMNLSGVDAAE